MQHYIQGFLPALFDSVWLTNEERRPEDIQRILRNSNQLAIPFTRLVSLSEHPFINLPKTWIDFTNENIKIIRNKIEFKFELKKSLLSQLSSVVTCNRLMCPSCHLNHYMCEIIYCFIYSSIMKRDHRQIFSKSFNFISMPISCNNFLFKVVFTRMFISLTGSSFCEVCSQKLDPVSLHHKFSLISVFADILSLRAPQ